jgi:hypothetical protein
MGRYRNYLKQAPSKPRNQLNPIWRGIGCLFIIITPVLSYVSARLILGYGLANGWPIPAWMLGTPRLPAFILQTPALYQMFAPLLSQTNLYAILTLTAAMIVFFAGLLSLIYALLYRIVGPPRFSPIDAPPPRVRTKTYKR